MPAAGAADRFPRPDFRGLPPLGRGPDPGPAGTDGNGVVRRRLALATVARARAEHMAPPVGLWAFAADARTERALRQGLEGREAATVQRGKLSEALQVLAKVPSPKLVLLDLDHASEPEAAFARLRTVCSFGTEFVALGSVNTASFASRRLHDGFADYLSKPVSAADVRNVCATLLDDLPAREYAGRVVGFAGSGGSGVSSLVVAAARESRARDRSCIILSLDPLLSGSFGLEPAEDLSELLLSLEDGRVPEFDRFDQGDVANVQGITLVAYPRVDALPVVPSIDTAQALVRHLANRASTVLLAGIPDPELLAELMKQSDVRVVLYEPTLLSINVAVRALALLGADNPALLVQCHPRRHRYSLSAAQMRYALGDRDPDVTLPHEATLHRQVITVDGRPRVSRGYRRTLKAALERIFEQIQ